MKTPNLLTDEGYTWPFSFSYAWNRITPNQTRMMYDEYTVEDFILDEDFRNWVLYPDAANRAFWQRWIQDHPDKVAQVEEARTIILSVEHDESDVDEVENRESWEKLKHRINDADALSAPLTPHDGAGFGWTTLIFYRVAAVLGGLFILVAVYYYAGSSRIEYATQFGEVKTIWLQDSSKVILNANSRMLVHRRLFSADTREVSLYGEAFFIVRKKPRGVRRKFVVHTDDIDVEVLGTCFNVNNRSGRSWVVLNSGRVQLNDNESVGQPLVMHAGELAEFSNAAGRFIVRKVDPEKFTSWRLNELIFDGDPLGDIITLLEQNYGFEVTLRDTTLLGRKFNGKLPADRPDILLSALAESFGLQVTRLDNTIIIDHVKEKTKQP